jgi:hypothetical protein
MDFMAFFAGNVCINISALNAKAWAPFLMKTASVTDLTGWLHARSLPALSEHSLLPCCTGWHSEIMPVPVDECEWLSKGDE